MRQNVVMFMLGAVVATITIYTVSAVINRFHMATSDIAWIELSGLANSAIRDYERFGERPTTVEQIESSQSILHYIEESGVFDQYYPPTLVWYEDAAVVFLVSTPESTQDMPKECLYMAIATEDAVRYIVGRSRLQ